MNRNIQTGVISGVCGTHVFLSNDLHARIYAHRETLSFSDPCIGQEVEFELRYFENMRNPVARDVKRIR